MQPRVDCSGGWVPEVRQVAQGGGAETSCVDGGWIWNRQTGLEGGHNYGMQSRFSKAEASEMFTYPPFSTHWVGGLDWHNRCGRAAYRFWFMWFMFKLAHRYWLRIVRKHGIPCCGWQVLLMASSATPDVAQVEDKIEAPISAAEWHRS